jgi:hypothetical protein
MAPTSRIATAAIGVTGGEGQSRSRERESSDERLEVGAVGGRQRFRGQKLNVSLSVSGPTGLSMDVGTYFSKTRSTLGSKNTHTHRVRGSYARTC